MHYGCEPWILRDIIEKLDLQPTDRLLDIGCGVGNLTIPLSFFVAKTVAVDHPDCVARIMRRLPEDRIRVVGGNWLELELLETFTKILIYDCVHYLSTIAEVATFIDRALARLEPHGLLLVGDIPNAGLRKRHDDSAFGSEFNIRWNKTLEASLPRQIEVIATGLGREDAIAMVKEDKETVQIGDAELLELVAAIRRAGYQAWLVPQHEERLPFATQREDLLVRRP